MATRNEHPERHGWWLDELESLGISTKRTNELNDLKELRSLTDNIKRAFYHEYKLPRTVAGNSKVIIGTIRLSRVRNSV